MKKEINKKQNLIKNNVSRRFLVAMSIVSMVGFITIFFESIFGLNFSDYGEFLLLIILGTGLILEARITHLKLIKTEGLTNLNFTSIITAVIGVFAIVTGILSFPTLVINSAIFESIKGMVAMIAIIIIIIETWIIE